MRDGLGSIRVALLAAVAIGLMFPAAAVAQGPSVSGRVGLPAAWTPAADSAPAAGGPPRGVPAPPANDDCAAPTIIAALPYTDAQDTSGATTDAGDPLQSCTIGGPSQNLASVWYSYTAPADMLLAIDTIGSQYDTVLTVYTGACGALTEVACDDDFGPELEAATVLPVTNGQTILIEVAGHTGGGGGGPLAFRVVEVQRHLGSYTDPTGDTLGVDPVQLDVSSVSACHGAGEVKISLDFSTPISPGDDNAENAVGGFIDIDTDQDFTTGDAPIPDQFSPHGLSALGVEYFISLFDVDSSTSTVAVFDQFGGFQGVASIVYGSSSVQVIVPLALLGGDDGNLDLAAVVGTPFEPTDVTPNGGSLRTVACVVPTCPAVPAGGCKLPTVAGKAQLQLKDKTPDTGDQLKWKWAKGAATTKADFGTPITGTDYLACLYDDVAGTPTLKLSALIPGGGICAGKPCWKENTKGFKYNDKDLTPHGIQKVQLKEGLAGKAIVQVKGKGLDLQTPTLPLAQAPSVTFQLFGNGQCWSAGYSAPAIKNQPDQFKDKSD